MIRTRFVINGQDMARVTTAFKVIHEISYEKIVTTQDGTEHEFGKRLRPIIEFSVMLSREATPEDYRALLQDPIAVEYDDPDAGFRRLPFRLDCNLEKTLECWNCVQHANFFSSGTIRLRCKEVINAGSI